MRIKTKKVYYCDFCKKKSLKTLEKHEKHCTGNINRECRMCGITPNYQEIVDKLKARYHIVRDEPTFENMFSFQQVIWHGEEITGKEITDLVDQCPACALTIIKHIDASIINIDFNYTEKCKELWSEFNEEYHHPDVGYCY